MLKLGDENTRQVKVRKAHPLYAWFAYQIDVLDVHPASHGIVEAFDRANEWHQNLLRLRVEVDEADGILFPMLHKEVEEFLAQTKESWGFYGMSVKGIKNLSKYLKNASLKHATVSNYRDIYESMGGPTNVDRFGFIEARCDQYGELFKLYGEIDRWLGQGPSTTQNLTRLNRHIPDGVLLADYCFRMMQPFVAICYVNPNFEKYILQNGENTSRLGKGGFRDKLLRGIWRLRGGFTRSVRGTGRQLWALCHAALEAMQLFDRDSLFYSWHIAENIMPELFEKWYIPNTPIFCNAAQSIRAEYEMLGVDSVLMVEGMRYLSKPTTPYGAIMKAKDRQPEMVEFLAVKATHFVSRETIISRMQTTELQMIDEKIPDYTMHPLTEYDKSILEMVGLI